MERGEERRPSQENEAGRSAESAFPFRLSETLRKEEQRLKQLRAELEEAVERYTAELKRATEKLERTLNDARMYAESIVNTIREPLIVLDANLKVISANQAFYSMFHVRPEETEGKFIYDLGNRQWDIPELRRLLETILPQHTFFNGYEVSHTFKGIGPKTMLLNARQIYRGDIKQQLILLAIEDITERKQSEEKSKRSKELSDAVNSINTVLFSTLDFDEIMNRVVEETAKVTRADWAVIYMPEDSSWVAKYVYGLPEFAGRHLAAEDIKYSIRAVKERRPVLINDTLNDEEACDTLLMEEYGVRALLDAPLMVGEDIIGNFSLYSCRKEEFTGQHVDFIKKVSASVSLAAKNARLFDEVRKVKERASFFANALETSSQPFVALHTDGSFMQFNRAYLELTRRSSEELRSMTMMDLTPPAYHAYEAAKITELQRTGQPQLYQKEYLRRDGTRVPIEIKLHMVTDEKGAPDYYYAFVTDITERKQAEAALQGSKNFLENVMQSVTNAIYVLDREGLMVQLNHAAFEMTGYAPEELIGKPFSVVFDKSTLPEIEQLFTRVVMYGESIINYETQIVRKDGSRRFVISSSVPLKENGTITGVVGASQDITERKRLEEEIRHMAHHDELTGLPNRRLFMDIIKVESAQARRHGTKMALLFLDLDRFKEVNDTLGHGAGDRLLQEVAGRLRATVREYDTISRVGGDEFNIILGDISRVEVVGEVARKIIRAFRHPFLISDHTLHITTSIGISIYPDDTEDIDTLFRYADIALYHAKEQGRNNYQFYNSEITVRSVERIKMEGMLRQMMEREELTVYYQPQIDMHTRRMVCAEALVRWRHPQRGLLEPKQFIPAAEETGLIMAIDEWVLRTVCEQVSAWRESGLPPVCITVNLSARAFQNPDLVSTIAQILKETGTPPQYLDIEITETLAMSNAERTSTRLRELQEMGVHTSLDDFGTGYSSLSYLKKLSIQKLKIDRSFIQDIATDPDDRAVISAVTVMAHTLGIKVLAEGVETEDQLSFLHATHCDEAQGYLFSKPLPAEGLKELIAAGR